MLVTKFVYMPFHLCYAIALPCKTCVISAVFTLKYPFWTVLSYIITWQPQELCITLRIAMYMSISSRWTTT